MNTYMKHAAAALTLLGLTFTVAPAMAAEASGASAPITAGAAGTSLPQVEGEIRKVDAEAGKLTIRHGPIDNLEMGAMTMIFRVNDPAMLSRVQPGDKVRFTVDRIEGLLTVTSLSAAP